LQYKIPRKFFSLLFFAIFTLLDLAHQGRCRAIKQTAQRMAAQSVVLCLQDTTELDFNGQQAQGLGPLSYEAQRGMYVHPTYA
jgi:hypothetical protein